MITVAVAYQDGRRVPGELALVDAFEAGSGEGAFVWVHVEEPSAEEFAAVTTEFKASGGVNLETVRAIAETGVERISVGALTHSAVCLDVALDWEI